MGILEFCLYPFQASKGKSRGPESILYKSTWPLFSSIRLFGLAPYDFESDDLMPSNKYAIFSVFWMALYTYIYFFLLFSSLIIVHRHDMRFTTSITELTKATMNYIIVMSDIIIVLCTRKKMTKIWNRIQDFDQIVRDLGYGRSEENTFIWVCTVLFFNACIWSAVSILGITGFSEPWIKNVSYMIIYVGSAASVIRFSGIAMILAQRFGQLNDIIQITVNTILKPRWIVTNAIARYEFIGYLHDHLMVTAESLNSIFHWPIFLWLINLSVHCISSSYFALSWLLDSLSKPVSVYSTPLYCLIAWVMAFALQMFLLCHACHQASYEANTMAVNMLEKRNSCCTHDRKMEVETSFHLVNRQLHFSAAGFFHVNLLLFATITSVTTTYLCILLQIN